MSNTVIKVENVSKQYRLGKIGTGSFAHDLNRWWHTIRGKDDPYRKVGEENDRARKAESEYVWALKDVSFDIDRGDVVGVIGRNGAGKSTLLKLLSRTTLPTTGTIKAKGRIASLLEVGTGFHPELSGRENIYLNGAILGMTKQEVRNKFDEIVDFAGVERYIDTPVKRYSSGMYVRLAFAVAAHLEPEILIVDEVLAVGDAEFQKKALGKMRDVSTGEGRTVLFVSHNMTAITQLCKSCLLLNKGMLEIKGNVHDVTDAYRNSSESKQTDLTADANREGTGFCRIRRIEVVDGKGVARTMVAVGERVSIHIHLQKNIERSLQNLRIIVGVYNNLQEGFLRFDTKSTNGKIEVSNEKIVVQCELQEPLNIKPDKYYINVAIYEYDVLLDYVSHTCQFSIDNFDYFGTGREIENPELSKVFYKHLWTTVN